MADMVLFGAITIGIEEGLILAPKTPGKSSDAKHLLRLVTTPPPPPLIDYQQPQQGRLGALTNVKFRT